MKEKRNQFDKETCSTGGCSVKHIWLGMVVIFIVMAIAFIFGN
ncbi:MAG: hypothetical protein ACXVHS_01135 [Methanobacterium sp.]